MRPKHFVRRLERRFLPERTHARRRRKWEALWSREEPTEPWIHRGVSKEIVEAVETGWFPGGCPALDVGCGQGDVTHWLAGRGFPSLGIDFADAAVQRARKRYGEVPGRLEFRTCDIEERVPGGGPFGIVVDRGCFHSIPRESSHHYVRHLARSCAAGARFLLFIRAFRGDTGLAHGEEREFHERRIGDDFSDHFEILRSDETSLMRRAESMLAPQSGLVFWMRGRGAPAPEPR